MERKKVMNLTADELISFSADQLFVLNGLVSAAKEAMEASELIHRTYRKYFSVDNYRIEVWRDKKGNNFEYLTQDGVWQARYLRNEYEVQCTLNGIFDLFRAEWLILNDIEKATFDSGSMTEIGQKSKICTYFRAFLSRTQQMGNC